MIKINEIGTVNGIVVMAKKVVTNQVPCDSCYFGDVNYRCSGLSKTRPKCFATDKENINNVPIYFVKAK